MGRNAGKAGRVSIFYVAFILGGTHILEAGYIYVYMERVRNIESEGKREN